MENVICGFIEVNGELVKISSVKDLKAIAARLGSAFTELTTRDYITKLSAINCRGNSRLMTAVYCIRKMGEKCF